MINQNSFFNVASALSRHASTRQEIVANNIANADTPHFLAKRLEAFDEIYRGQNGSAMNATRKGHIAMGDVINRGSITTSRTEVDLNGNSVSLEEEMIHSAEAKSEHDRALALYNHGLKVLRLALGRSA